MSNLDKIKCPICKNFLIAREGDIIRTSSFNDCLRQCKNCGIGLSNARKNPTMIFNNFSNNVPELLRTNLDDTLNNSINKVNLNNKKNKFAFSTSEDALTWSFFKYFVVKNKFNDLLQLLNIDSDENYCDIYLWGTNISSQIVDTDFSIKFNQVSDSFNENPLRRTEPDVILKLKDKLIFIEVKYQSSNNVTTDKSKFNKYLIPNVDFEKLCESGHYELYRNWAFASKLSEGKQFELINLGLQKLFTDKNCIKLNQFESSLNVINGNFFKISWEQIINKLDEKESEYDLWFLVNLKNKCKIINYEN